MDLLAFTSNAIDSLAWPVAILVLGLVFRKQFRNLIPLISKLKAGPLEAEFEMDTKQVLANTKEVSSHKVSNMNIASTKFYKKKEAVAMLMSARHDPAGMILKGWAGVDGALYRLGTLTGSVVDPMDSANNVYKAVMSSDILIGDTKRLVMELYELRNRVAYANVNPTVTAAQDYLLAVDQVVELIQEHQANLESADPTEN